MNVKKAVITAAAPGQRLLPVQLLTDRDGEPKAALRILIEEALGAGAEEVCVVVSPGDEALYGRAAGPHARSLRFVVQPEPLGYGHALHCARDFVGNDAFLHLVGDHLCLSHEALGCARQLTQRAAAEACAVSGVQPTREGLLHRYGAVGGRRLPMQERLYLVEAVLEKPTPTQAELELLVPGLRSGQYLCFFGMHVLTGSVMELLAGLLKDAAAPVSLSHALALLARREKYLALEVAGSRYDLGVPYGLLNAQLALALEGRDRESVLAQWVELLANRQRSRG